MATDELSDELREIEHRRLDALVRADVDAAEALHADDYQLITPGGEALTRADYLAQIASGDLDYRTFAPVAPLAVRTYGEAAVLRYRVRIEVAWAGGGDADDFWHTDVYERREGRWQAVWSQATRIR